MLAGPLSSSTRTPKGSAGWTSTKDGAGRGRTAIAPRAPLSRQADQLAVTNAGGEVDIDLTAVQRQPPPASGQSVLKRQFEERLTVVAAQRAQTLQSTA